jgi:hypothetical protein
MDRPIGVLDRTGGFITCSSSIACETLAMSIVGNLFAIKKQQTSFGDFLEKKAAFTCLGRRELLG